MAGASRVLTAPTPLIHNPPAPRVIVPHVAAPAPALAYAGLPYAYAGLPVAAPAVVA